MTYIRFSTFLALALAFFAVNGGAFAQSEGQRSLVVVNDQPITSFDVEQRMRLNQILGYASGSEAQQRKEALEELIDDVVKSASAKRMGLEPNESQVKESIAKIAKNMNTTPEGLASLLSSKGVSMSALKQYVKASISFNWIATRQYNVKVEVDQAEVDRRLAAITTDPQFKPVAVYELQELSLPVEKMAEPMLGQLLYARAIEAQQILQRYNGCRTAKQAASGVFNVKISQVAQVPADKIPDDMKAVLEKVGPGKAIGPMRSPQGIQLIGYCGRRSIEPPKPTREMVENMLRNEKYRRASQRILKDLRRSAYIDYKKESRALQAAQTQPVRQTELQQPQRAVSVPSAGDAPDDPGTLKRLIEALQKKIDALSANN